MTLGKTTLLIVGVLAAAFLGVLGASEFMHWREQSRYEQKRAGLETGESSLLRQGEKFPDVQLTGLDGVTTTSQKLSESTNVLYLFLSVGCDPCTEAIENFDIAISLEPEDCNLYFLRGSSKSSAGDHNGAVADIKKAIFLSKIECKRNKEYEESLRDMGQNWGLTTFYETQLQWVMRGKKLTKQHRQLRIEGENNRTLINKKRRDQ